MKKRFRGAAGVLLAALLVNSMGFLSMFSSWVQRYEKYVRNEKGVLSEYCPNAQE